MSFPPIPAYPLGIDSDRTLFKVYNTSEAKTTANNLPWSQEISIEPVGENEDEIWAENGFATINGELFYYDAVGKDSNGKINKFKRCGRNLGGKKTQFNAAGTWVRGFVVAEHHEQLTNTILNVENFIGINFDENVETLDYRIRHLQNLPYCDDECPDVTLQFQVTQPSTDACTGTIVSYSLLINGFFKTFKIDFGDGTSTTSEQTGTHTYPPNAIIDPIVTVSNDNCQVVQSAIERNNSTEPTIDTPNTGFDIDVPEITEFPPIVVPNTTQPETTFTLPQIFFPCELEIGPSGPIFFPSIIVVDPPIPSEIVFSPLDIPSLITFDNIPTFSPIDFGPAPSFSPIDFIVDVSFTTIDFGPAPSFSPISFGPAPSFSPISFGPAPSYSPIGFGPAPSYSPIGFGPAPSFSPIGFGPAPSYSPIGFGPAPSFSPIGFGPAPSFSPIGFDVSVSLTDFSPIGFGPAPSYSPIGFGPAPSYSPIGFGPAPSYSPIGFGPAPSYSPISFGPAPSYSPISFGPAPSYSPIGFGPAPSIAPVNFGPAPVVSVDWNTPTISAIISLPSVLDISMSPISFGPAPDISISWGSAPSITFGTPPDISVSWGSAPGISVIWGTVPTISGSITVGCSSTPFRSNVDAANFSDPFINMEMEMNTESLGIPSEINIVAPTLPDLSIIHTIPETIVVEVPKFDDIKIIGPEIPLPKEIRIYSDITIPNVIKVESNIPQSILIDSSNLPNLKLEIPEKLPKFEVDASSIPTEIQVVGLPSMIEIKNTIPSLITVVPDESLKNLEIPIVFTQPMPIEVKFDFKTPNGETGDAPCFALVPCGK